MAIARAAACGAWAPSAAAATRFTTDFEACLADPSMDATCLFSDQWTYSCEPAAVSCD